jgi:hypothetical protein
METTGGRKTPAPYGQACVNCVKAKCRCMVREGGVCERYVGLLCFRSRDYARSHSIPSSASSSRAIIQPGGLQHLTVHHVACASGIEDIQAKLYADVIASRKSVCHRQLYAREAQSPPPLRKDPN